MLAAMSPEEEVIQLAADCAADPLRWSEVAYDWGEGELAEYDGPREWQREAFAQIRDHLQGPATRFQPLMLARASGHGIGKSAFIGMVTNWALSTCDDCKVVITACRSGQHVASRKLLRGVANGHCGMAIKDKQGRAGDLCAGQDHPSRNADRPGIEPGVNHVVSGDMDLRQLAHLGLKSADTLHCGGRRSREDAAQNGEIAHGRSSWRNARLVSRNPLLRSSTAARLPPVGALTSRPTAPR